MNGYADPAPSTVPKPLTSEDISALFSKAPGWFSRDAVRKRFYAKGFPKPFDRGLWSPKAVADWIANPVPLTGTPRAKPSGRRPNGYSPVE
jgi:hypothetical protein